MSRLPIPKVVVVPRLPKTEAALLAFDAAQKQPWRTDLDALEAAVGLAFAADTSMPLRPVFLPRLRQMVADWRALK